MNLYRVPYVHRTAPDANPHEKILYVVANSPEEASAYVNRKPGHEAQGANVHTPNVEIVTGEKTAAPVPFEKRKSVNVRGLVLDNEEK